MINNISSTLLKQNNTIPARKLKTSQNSKYVQAPDYLPKYSANDELNKHAEIRKISEQYRYASDKKKKRNKTFFTLIVSLIPVVAGFILYKE